MLQEQLTMLESQLNGIASNWNGDDSGKQEERALTSLDSLEKLQDLKTLLNELNISLNKEYIFLKKNNEYYIVSEDIKNIELSNLNIKSIGLLFAKYKNNKLILNEDVKDLNL